MPTEKTFVSGLTTLVATVEDDKTVSFVMTVAGQEVGSLGLTEAEATDLSKTQLGVTPDVVLINGTAFSRQDVLSILLDRTDDVFILLHGQRLLAGKGKDVFNNLVLWWNEGAAPSTYNPQTGRFE